MSHDTFRSLFAYKFWANAELFAVLVSLQEEHSEQRHTCLRALNHTYIVDRVFRAHLIGEQRPFDETSSAEKSNYKALKTTVVEIDRWYQDYANHASPEMLSEVVHFTFTSGNSGRMSREEILLHVITHGVYHRGSVAQVLKSISVTPPDDPYTVFLHQMQPDRRVT